MSATKLTWCSTKSFITVASCTKRIQCSKWISFNVTLNISSFSTMSCFWLHILVWLVGALQPEVPESSLWSTLRTRAPEGERAAAFHPAPWLHQTLESSALLVHNLKLRRIQQEDADDAQTHDLLWAGWGLTPDHRRQRVLAGHRGGLAEAGRV